MATPATDKMDIPDGTDGSGPFPPITINEVNGRFILYDVEGKNGFFFFFLSLFIIYSFLAFNSFSMNLYLTLLLLGLSV